MNYIVFDLEWNMVEKKENVAESLQFEIIEIGAVKLDEKGNIIDQFNRLIKPQISKEIHFIISKLVHVKMEELEDGITFCEMVNEFIEWCGKEYTFCTWGPIDLMELQKNMTFYEMEPLAKGPIAYLDIQKLFSLDKEDGISRRSLEIAIDHLGIEKDIPFHRASSDAYYTAKILQQLRPKVMQNYSFDVYVLPPSKKEEIYIEFSNYSKYITRAFAEKQEALEEPKVIALKCFHCHRNIKRKVKWFSPNGKNYYTYGFCEKHGFIKSKVRIRKNYKEQLYVVKTTKFISNTEAQLLHEKYLKLKNKQPSTLRKS